MAREINKILFLGLGGAGQRHLRVFRSLLPNAYMFAWRRLKKTPLLSADFKVLEGKTIEEHYNIDIFSDLEDAYAQNPDLVVISLPSALQADAVIDAASRGFDIFVEKPGAINMRQCLQINDAVRKSGVGYFVSFQRRFHPLVQKMKSVIESGLIGKNMSVFVKVGSYVPTWHTYEDFRDLYACRADLGGGVLRTESHELDLIAWFFGPPKKVYGVIGCRGPYALDVEDSANLILDYGDFSAQISLCFMQQNQERIIEINGTDGWLKCDLNNHQLLIESRSGCVKKEQLDNSFNMDEMFTSQAKYFINDFDGVDLEYLNATCRLMTIINNLENSSTFTNTEIQS